MAPSDRPTSARNARRLRAKEVRKADESLARAVIALRMARKLWLKEVAGG